VLLVPVGMASVGMSVGNGRAAYATPWGQTMVVIGIASVEACWVWAGPLRCRAAHLLGRRPPASPKALLNGRESARRRLLRPRAWLSACTSYRIVSTQTAAVTVKGHRIMNLSAAEAADGAPRVVGELEAVTPGTAHRHELRDDPIAAPTARCRTASTRQGVR
jgi:hypothetical protein